MMGRSHIVRARGARGRGGSTLVAGAWMVAACLLGAGTAGCASPVQDDAIESWGGEVPGVPEGEFHRPGQPCVLCHGDYHGAGPIMSVAGTVFATPRTARPVGGVKVTITDSDGNVASKTTNCIGNFFFTEEEFTPVFPLRAEIECPVPGTGATKRLVMGTRIGRDGSCANCHNGPPEVDSPGWIYCAETMPEPPYVVPQNCQGKAPE
jgi:hypothetical protein